MEAVSLVPLRNVSCSGAESYAQAWKEGNESVAQYMLRNITGMLFRCSASSGPRAHLIILESNVERLANLSARDVCSFQFHLMAVTLKVSTFFFSHQRELLASKVLEIGRSHLNGGARDRDKKIDSRAEEAVMWLQKAFTLAEHLDDTLTAGAVELKV